MSAGVRRRDLVRLLGGAVSAAACGNALRAQPANRLPTIGFLSPASPAVASNRMFLRGLAELGYADGKNIALAPRYAEGRFDRLPALAAGLVAQRVDVIAAGVTQASLAARDATRTIPIVMLGVGDPVGAGLIASLARPGGNVTGTSSMSAGVIGKSLEVLKEAVPGAERVAILWNPANAVFQAQMMREAQVAASALRMLATEHGARGPHEFEAAFAAIANAGAQAMLVMPDPVTTQHTARIVDFARRARLPAIYGTREQAEAGGLMTYGPDIPEQFRRGATFVDKILKGAKPSELPVEQPAKFELIVNLKTAKALGLAIPSTLMVRADEVIE
jgi:putative ABC transport system substrate-binding protein